MNVFYEEDGGFKVGAVLSTTEATLQVEAAHGKRSKIKSSAVVLEFQQPALADFMAAAEAAGAALDLDFLWECAPPDEFAYAALAAEYFGHAPSPVEAAALVLRLHGAPMYFYKKGKGRYKAAPQEALQAALAQMEKRRQAAILQAEYEAQLQAGVLPEALRSDLDMLLFKPDKNATTWKALDAACAALHLPPPKLLHQVGALPDAYAYHRRKFAFAHELSDHLKSRATSTFSADEARRTALDLPLHAVPCFSIDDVTTTEIDDAFSVERLADGNWRVGIHIAAPGLGIAPNDAVDEIARRRLSTVYMPGDKITMLPDAVIEAYTLREGDVVPAVSLYVTVSGADFSVLSEESRIELISVAANLRHNLLDAFVTPENLANDVGDYAFKTEIGVLWKLALVLEKARGADQQREDRLDYNFYIDWPKNEDGQASSGTASVTPYVRIEARKRGAPLDKLVAEMMIRANFTWGKLLDEKLVPGLYRTQTAGKVKMSTHAAPHEAMGLSHYAWSSSPLRRYVDLVNQWQLISVLRETPPPFAPKSADLFAILGAFDTAYTTYNEFQQNMERYWCLRWLEQEGLIGTGATVQALRVREEVVRLTTIPLYLKVGGLPEVVPNGELTLELKRIDTWEVSAEARLVHVGFTAPADPA